MEWSVVSAKLEKGLDWETHSEKGQALDSILFGRQEELVHRVAVILFREINSQCPERMIGIVATQISNATTQRFNEAAILFRRRLVVLKTDTDILQSLRGLQCHDKLFDNETFSIVRQWRK